MPTMPHMAGQATDASATPGAASPALRRAYVTVSARRRRSTRRRRRPGGWVGASTITRTSGSVPLGRTSTRPWSPSSASTLAICRRSARRRRASALGDRHVDEHLRQPGHRRRGEVGQRAPGRTTASASTTPVSSPSPVVARSRKITWPLCSPPSEYPPLAERLEHVAVADRRLDHVDAGGLHRQAEPEVGHHGDDDRVVAQRAPVAQVAGADGDDVVAVDDGPGVVDGHRAVGVTVEGQPEIGAVRRRTAAASEAGVGGPHPALMLRPSGSVVDHDDVGAGRGRGPGRPCRWRRRWRRRRRCAGRRAAAPRGGRARARR